MKIIIGGDVSIQDSAPLFAEGGVQKPFGNVVEAFRASDRVLTNLECAITDKASAWQTMGKPLASFPSSPRAVKAWRTKAGIPIGAPSRSVSPATVLFPRSTMRIWLTTSIANPTPMFAARSIKP
ncbi:MAG: CapA family protein [Clostridia bacterium]|nr:CapA family protein [Clostridia bacterium]